MPVGFGFSAGDFIAALKLVGTIIDVLRESGEAGLAYRELVHELYSLETALLHVKRLDGEDIPQAQIISLQQVAAQCQSTIDDFWKKVQKYQPHLGCNQSTTLLKSGWMKVRWAICKKEDLARFKACLSGHTGAINMLLLAIGMSQKTVQGRKQDQQHATLTGLIQTSYFQCMKRLHSIGESLTRSVIQGKQLLEMIERVIRTNIEIFRTVLQIQAIITHIPGQVQRQQPVYLIDALGKHSPFYLEFIRSADAFTSVLKANFKKIKRAPEKIDRGEFVIQDSALKRDIDLSQDWELCFKPGQCVDMSMVFHRATAPLESAAVCPACGNDKPDYYGIDAVCSSCGMTFRQMKEVIDDRPVAMDVSHPSEDTRSETNSSFTVYNPAQPKSCQRTRTDDNFEDFRQFQRVRMYTSLRLGPVAARWASDVYAKVFEVGRNSARPDSGYCFFSRYVGESLVFQVIRNDQLKSIICSTPLHTIRESSHTLKEGFLYAKSHGTTVKVQFNTSQDSEKIRRMINLNLSDFFPSDAARMRLSDNPEDSDTESEEEAEDEEYYDDDSDYDEFYDDFESDDDDRYVFFRYSRAFQRAHGY